MTLTQSRRRKRTVTLLTALTITIIGFAAVAAAWQLGWNVADANPATTAAAPTNQPYANSAALVAAIKSAGVACDGFQVTNAADISQDSGTCSTDGARELVITIYANPEDRKAFAQAFMSGVTPRTMILVGPNWTVYGSNSAVGVLTDKLGGTRYASVG